MSEDQAGAEPAEEQAAAPVKVCPNCSAQARTEGRFCPQCGAPYERLRHRGGRRRKLIAIAVLTAVVVAAAAAAVVLKVRHDNHVAAQRRAAAAAASQQQQAQQTATNDLKAADHKDLVNQLKAAVKKDAQKDVADGTLNGPAITKADCQPSDGSSVSDASVHSANFSCIAVNSTSADGTDQGYRFSATVNYDSGQISWHLGGQ